MNKIYSFCKMLFASLAMLFMFQGSFGQNIQWQKCLGGSDFEGSPRTMQTTSDGGYILMGVTSSYDGDVSGDHGSHDIWLVKFTATGVIQWQKCLGGTGTDEGGFIRVTSDGGYILTGRTNSNDGDVSGNHGGFYDVWVVKLDSVGTIQWQKCLGGSDDELGLSIEEKPGGGYILQGFTASNDGDVSGLHNSIGSLFDIWVVKLSALGGVEWQKCLGGNNMDFGVTIEHTSDGGYILLGFTSSNDGDVSGNHGMDDIWIVRLDSTGGIQWQKCLGGSDSDFGSSIKTTSDGGWLLSGSTRSNDGDVSGNHGEQDIWWVKLNSVGTIQWQKCFGGSSVDGGYIEATSGGGYMLKGTSESFDGDVVGNHGASDAWLVKLDSMGSILWQKCLGGTYGEGTSDLQPTSDGGYILMSYTYSNDGDVSGYHNDGDIWIAKLNATGGIQWQKCLGGSTYEEECDIFITPDGGYLVIGTAESTDGDVVGSHGGEDIWIVKLNSFGTAVSLPISLTDLDVSPNPISNNTLTLNYHLTQSTPIEIIITDVLGNTILSSKEPTQSAEAHQKVLTLDNLASGTYFLQLKTENGSRSMQMVKN